MLLYDLVSVLLILGVLAFEAGGDPPHGTHLVAAVFYLNGAIATVVTVAVCGWPAWVAVCGCLVFLTIAVLRVVCYQQPPQRRRRRR